MTVRSTMALGALAISTRVFYSVTVDANTIGNSAWLCAILGAVLALPMAMALSVIDRREARIRDVLGKSYPLLRAALGIVLLLYSVLDAAISMRVLVGSGIRLALNEFSEIALLLVLAGMLFLCAKYGQESVGNAARFWNRVFFAILALQFLLNIPIVDFRYLTPILGSGIPAILEKSLDIAGIYTILIGLRCLSGPMRSPNSDPGVWRKVYLEAVFISVVLATLYSTQFPVQLDESNRFAFQIDRLLTNGQFVSSMQFLVIFAWYTSWMFTALFYILTGVCALRMIVLKCTLLWACAIVVVSACAISLYSSFQYSFPVLLSQLRVVLFLLPCVALAIVMFIRERRRARA